MTSGLRNIWQQTRPSAAPPLTEKNLSDQTDKVSIVTGGYAGCGYQLVKILYQHNATVYVAGRSREKGAKAIEEIKAAHPDSRGRLEFLELDLSDLSKIKASADDFKSREQKLHVLTNNAGVMIPPGGSKGAQGHELQMVTNCLGPFLFTQLLMPLLEETAATAQPGEVRVTWAASGVVDLSGPKFGVEFDSNGNPKVFGSQGMNYAQSKCGNIFYSTEFKRRNPESKVMHLAWNPGNLRSDLQRHVPSLLNRAIGFILYEPIYGAYTELFAGYSTDIKPQDSGRYVLPWGRIATYRATLERATKPEVEGGTGHAARFWEWTEKEIKPFL